MIPTEATCGVRMTSDERKASIIAACVPLFAKKGFTATTTKEIADVAGVSEALLYRHFKSKDEIYNSIHQQICSTKDEVIGYFEKLPLQTESLATILYFLITVVNLEQNCPVRDSIPRLFIMSFLEDGQFVKDFNEIKFAPLIPIIGKIYDYSKKMGDIRPDINLNPQEILWFCYHIAIGMRLGTLPRKIYDYGYESDDLVKLHALEFVLRGIGIKESIIKSLDLKKMKEQVISFLPQ